MNKKNGSSPPITSIQSNSSNSSSLSLTPYLLTHSDNYKPFFSCYVMDVIYKNKALLIEYLRFISLPPHSVTSHKHNLNKFVVLRGIDTIYNVFQTILFYTKNVELAFYHSQRAFYLYVEYIEQSMTDENMYLNLSSRDATLFVYKKTIFDINPLLRKTVYDKDQKEQKEKDICMETECMELLLNYKNILKYLLFFFISDQEHHENSFQVNTFPDSIEQISSFMDKMFETRLLKKHVELFSMFLEGCFQQYDMLPFPSEDYYHIFELFIKKVSKIKQEGQYKKIKEKVENSHSFLEYDTNDISNELEPIALETFVLSFFSFM